jgi:hypothetical protein
MAALTIPQLMRMNIVSGRWPYDRISIMLEGRPDCEQIAGGAFRVKDYTNVASVIRALELNDSQKLTACRLLKVSLGEVRMTCREMMREALSSNHDHASAARMIEKTLCWPRCSRSGPRVGASAVVLRRSKRKRRRRSPDMCAVSPAVGPAAVKEA